MKKKVLEAIALLVIATLWIILTLLYSSAGRARGLPRPTLTNYTSTPGGENFSHSKLNLTYGRILCPETNCSGVFISVRTATKFHKSRLMLLLHTWLQAVDPKQVQIVTDQVLNTDRWINAAKLEGFTAVMPPQCKVHSHERTSLCCKTGYEFEQYFKATKAGKKFRWFCHFDDDEYVNIPVLMKTLRVHEDKVYLGHFGSEYWGFKGVTVDRLRLYPEHKNTTYYYPNGAAYCISSAVMPQIEKYVSGSRALIATCDKLRLVDDMAIGAVVDGILGYNLTEISTMYSHINTYPVVHINGTNQVAIYYEQHQKAKTGAAFTDEQDPTGFLSYHCLLYPSTSWCRPN